MTEEAPFYAILKIELSKNIFQRIEIDRPMSIGRKNTNDIVLVDSLVVDHHANINVDPGLTEGMVTIEDLGSHHPVQINGQEISGQSVVLKNKDAIRIGKTKIFFQSNDPEESDEFLLRVNLEKKTIADYSRREVVASKAVLFTLPTVDEVLNEIYDIAREKFSRLPLSNAEKINLDSAFTEAVGNAQRHGNTYNTRKMMQVYLDISTRRVTMMVTDEGAGFDVRRELRKKMEQTPEQQAVSRRQEGGYGGLGLTMISRSVDEILFNRKGNEITLIKYLPWTSAAKDKPAPANKTKQETPLAKAKAAEPTPAPTPAPSKIESEEKPKKEQQVEVKTQSAPEEPKKNLPPKKIILDKTEERPKPEKSKDKAVEKEQDETSPETAELPQSRTVQRVEDKPLRAFVRRVRLNHYAQMVPQQNFPLRITLSKEPVEEIGYHVEDMAREERGYSTQRRLVEIVPIFPGCICIPQKMQVDIISQQATAKFWLTPYAQGPLTEARIELWHRGVLAKTIAVPTRTAKKTDARLVFAAALLLPLLFTIIEWLNMNASKGVPALLRWLNAIVGIFGSASLTGFICAGIGIGYAAAMYAKRLPRQGTPIKSHFEY